MCERTPGAAAVAFLTSDRSKDILIQAVMLKRKGQGWRSCVNYPRAAGKTCPKRWRDSKGLRLHRFFLLIWIQSLKLFISEDPSLRFHGFVILKNWVNLRNQDLNRICERKRGKASILEGLQLWGRWLSERRARDTAVIRKPDYVHVMGRRLLSVVCAAQFLIPQV